MKDAFLAGLLSLTNASVAYYLAIRSVGLSYTRFVKSVFGGMAIRIVLMAAIAIILIKSGLVATIPFFLWLVLYYIIHQVIEIGMLNNQMPEMNKNNGENAK